MSDISGQIIGGALSGIGDSFGAYSKVKSGEADDPNQAANQQNGKSNSSGSLSGIIGGILGGGKSDGKSGGGLGGIVSNILSDESQKENIKPSYDDMRQMISKLRGK